MGCSAEEICRQQRGHIGEDVWAVEATYGGSSEDPQPGLAGGGVGLYEDIVFAVCFGVLVFFLRF